MKMKIQHNPAGCTYEVLVDGFKIMEITANEMLADDDYFIRFYNSGAHVCTLVKSQFEF